MLTRLKALVLIRRNSDILAIKGADQHEGKDYYRIVGGTIEFQERSEDAARREIREELNSDLDNLKFHGVVENKFDRKGEPVHQIEFIYTADLTDKSLYEKDHIEVIEPGVTYQTDWVPYEKVKNGEVIMFPNINYGE